MAEKGKQDERRKLLFKWRFAFMREEGLTSTQKVVMHTLGAYMDLDGRGCVPGLSRIARESSLARGTVILAIQELAGRWLKVTNRRSISGDADTNEYCATIPQGVVSQDDPTSKNTSNSNSTDTSDNESDEVRVFEYWADQRTAILPGSTRTPKRTSQRLSKVKARLSDGYTIEDLKLAVDGCLGSQRNVDGGYVDLELICRDDQHVTQYIQWARTSADQHSGGYDRL